MEKNKSLLFLTLYYFSFTLPQYIKDVYYVYDRVSIQILFISILNLIVFLSVIKSFDYKDFLKKVTFKSEILKKNIKLNVSNSALRTVDYKGGLDNFLKTVKPYKLSKKAKVLKNKILSKT